MMKKFALLYLCIIGSVGSMAQTTFQKHFGGATNGFVNHTKPTSDGGYILAGYTQSPAVDFFMVKTDSLAKILWAKIYGTTGTDMLADVIQTSDGGFMMAGYRNISFNYDMLFIKTDANGDTLFTRCFGGYRTESANRIIQTADGGYLAVGAFSDNSTGQTNTSILIYKMNAAGDSSWCKVLDASYEVASQVTQTADGGYVIAGTYSNNQFQSHSFLLKIDAAGTVQWNKTYIILGNDYLYSSQQTIDGGFILGGATIPGGGLNNKLFLIRTNAVGDTLWTSTYGGQYLDDGGYAQQTSDGGFIQCGRTENFGANSIGDGCLIKTNANGTINWSKRYGGSQGERLESVHQTGDGGFISGGSIGSVGPGYAWVVKTDSTGNSNCLQNATPALAYHPPVSMGTMSLTALMPNAWSSVPLINVSSMDTTIATICITVSSISQMENQNKTDLYPNPVFNISTLQIDIAVQLKNASLTIVDIAGKIIKSIPIFTHEVIIDRQGIASGSYYYQIINNYKTMATGKMIVY
jgi:hypothetical protein